MLPPRTITLVAPALLALVAPLVPAAPAAAVRAAPDPPASVVATTRGCSFGSEIVREVVVGYDTCYQLTLDGQVRGSGYQAVPETAGHDVVAVSAGYRHGLAVDDAGDVVAWGVYGEGPGAPAVTVPPVVANDDITHVAAGGFHDLALTENSQVVAWEGGRDDDGAADVPDEVEISQVTRIAAGTGISAAIADDGELFVWGAVDTLPAALDDAVVTRVDLGTRWGLALTAGGDLVRFGAGPALDPPAAVRSGDVVAFTAGDEGAMAVLADGTVHQWGVFDGEPGADFRPAVLDRPVADVEAYRHTAVITYAALAVVRGASVTGLPVNGTYLTAGAPRFTDRSVGVRYQWRRDATPIPGATGPRYRVTAADVGHRLRVVASSTGDRYPVVSSVSEQTSPARYQPATLRVTVPTTVRRGQRVLVRASGLGPREAYKIRWPGALLATGTSGTGGNVRRVVVVPRTTPLGKRAVEVVASQANRTGRAVVTVRPPT